MKAVITGDLINSTRLGEEAYETVIDRLKDILQLLKDEEHITQYELYRGDAFQILVENAQTALSVLFIIRTYINSLAPPQERRGQKVEYNFRLALGVADVEGEVKSGITNEPPFVYSGRTLDAITAKNVTIGIRTEYDDRNSEFNTELSLLEYIMEQWTPTSAGILYHKLWGKTERVIADKLGISQSAVNQHSRQACWNGLKIFLNRYEQIIEKMSQTEQNDD